MKFFKLLALPRSLYYNLKLFGIRGLRMPLLISNNTKVRGVKKGKIRIKNMHRFMVQIGFGGTIGIAENSNSFLIIGKGEICFEGNAMISAGSSIRVDGGKLKVGNNFYCNKNCFISCCERIDIGNEVLLGWNVNIRDSDGHKIIRDGDSEKLQRIIIGSHVWLCSYVDVLKGVIIYDGCVVGWRCCVTKPIEQKNCLIVGIPGKVVAHNIQWKY